MSLYPHPPQSIISSHQSSCAKVNVGEGSTIGFAGSTVCVSVHVQGIPADRNRSSVCVCVCTLTTFQGGGHREGEELVEGGNAQEERVVVDKLAFDVYKQQTSFRRQGQL